MTARDNGRRVCRPSRAKRCHLQAKILEAERYDVLRLEVWLLDCFDSSSESVFCTFSCIEVEKDYPSGPYIEGKNSVLKGDHRDGTHNRLADRELVKYIGVQEREVRYYEIVFN